MVCSRARSSSDRTTMCRLRTSASCSGGLPGPHEHETEPHISQVTTDELLAPMSAWWPARSYQVLRDMIEILVSHPDSTRWTCRAVVEPRASGQPRSIT